MPTYSFWSLGVMPPIVSVYSAFAKCPIVNVNLGVMPLSLLHLLAQCAEASIFVNMA